MRRKSYILATDLDGTLVGDKLALQSLLNYYEEAALDLALVYITGRHLASTLSLISSEGLPNPDILITDVGTVIYTLKSLTEDRNWTKKMQNNWQPERIIQISSIFPTLVRQALPDNKRISFTIHHNKEVVNKLQNALIVEKVPHKLIFSSNRDVDILPEQGGKGAALKYVLQTFASNEAQILIAGDSGNDMDMLTLGYPSVSVGNAQPELVKMNDHPLLFRSTKNYAEGILEAWLHFFGKENLSTSYLP